MIQSHKWKFKVEHISLGFGRWVTAQKSRDFQNILGVENGRWVKPI